MQVEEEYAPLIHSDATVLLRPRTGLQDMTIEIETGHAASSSPRARRSRSRRPSPTCSPTRSSPRSTATPAPTCSCCSRAQATASAAGARSSRRPSGASSRSRATWRGSARRSRSAATTSAARSPTSSWSARSSAPTTPGSSEFVDSSNAVLGRVRRPGGSDPRVAPGAAEHAHRDPLGARERRAVRQRPRPVVGGPDPRRAGARPGAARGPAAVREHDPGADQNQIRPFARAAQTPVRHLTQAAQPLADHDQGPARHLHRAPDRSATRSPTTRPARPRRATCSGSPGSTTTPTRSSSARTRWARCCARVVMFGCQTAGLAEGVAAPRPFLRTLQQMTNVPSSSDPRVCPPL